jgi:hypothetical protein
MGDLASAVAAGAFDDEDSEEAVGDDVTTDEAIEAIEATVTAAEDDAEPSAEENTEENTKENTEENTGDQLDESAAQSEN